MIHNSDSLAVCWGLEVASVCTHINLVASSIRYSGTQMRKPMKKVFHHPNCNFLNHIQSLDLDQQYQYHLRTC